MSRTREVAIGVVVAVVSAAITSGAIALYQTASAQAAAFQIGPSLGEWQALSVAAMQRPTQAGSDGFLIAFSGGNGDIARFYLQTGSSAETLEARTRAGQYEGAMIPVRAGDYYRVSRRDGEMATVSAFWIPLE